MNFSGGVSYNKSMDSGHLIKLGVGIVLLIVSAWAFKKPEHFLHGRKARFWIGLIGEARTLAMVRWISVPLLVIVGGFLIAAGLGYIDLK